MAQRNVEIARRWWASFNENGVPPLELCNEHVFVRNPDGFPVTGPYHGHAGIRQWALDVYDVLEDFRVEPEEVIPLGEGGVVLVGLRQTGRWKYTQLPTEVLWATLMTIRNGKLVHAQGYVSKAQALRAAGAE